MTVLVFIRDVVDTPGSGCCLRARVLSGTLKPGMEARLTGSVLMIRQLYTVRDERTLARAGIGRAILIKPESGSLDQFKSLRNKVLEFSDEQSVGARPEYAVSQ